MSPRIDIVWSEFVVGGLCDGFLAVDLSEWLKGGVAALFVEIDSYAIA
jgi:hypothetical protein